MAFADESHLMLYDAPRRVPLHVVQILFDAGRRCCAAHGIHEGDRLTCVDQAGDALLVDVDGRGLARLDLALTLTIEVEPDVA